MKKLYFFSLFVFPILVSAQKSVDLDRYRFSVQYMSLPKLRLDSTYHTYNVQVEGTKMMQPFLQDLSPEKSVLLEGWRKLQQDGHIIIKVKSSTQDTKQNGTILMLIMQLNCRFKTILYRVNAL